MEVSHDRAHLDDCVDCDASGDDASASNKASAAKIDEFRRVIRLEGALSAEQREALIAIADRCPVHRTLEASSRIVTEAATPIQSEVPPPINRA